MRGSTLPSLAKALEWSSSDGDGPVMARLVPLDCKPGRAACEAVLPEEKRDEKQVCNMFFFVSLVKFYGAVNVKQQSTGC